MLSPTSAGRGRRKRGVTFANMIQWYSSDGEHTKLNTYYRIGGGDGYYGWSPPEDPDPIGACAWCGEDIYNEDHVVDGDIICPTCDEYWRSNDIGADFIIKFFGSMPEIAKQCRYDDWMEMFAEYMRECEPGMLKQAAKKEGVE
jgi:hypothetical protein